MEKNGITKISIFCLFIVLLISLLFAENTEKDFHAKFKKTTINISFKGTNIDDVIKIFAEKMNVNIIRNENVKAKITANLKKINIIDALDIICRTHKINYLVEKSIASGPIIRIYTQQDYLEALMYRGTADVIKLKHSKAVDVYKKLQDAGAIKGKEGSAYGAGILYADEKSNSIIVVDKGSSINRSKLREIIDAFDQPTPQVLIEAKILSISLVDETKYGIDWNAVWSKGKMDVRIPMMDMPEKSASINKVWSFNDGGGSLTGIIKALETENDLKVLSSPRIVVLNNEEASIREGQDIPYVVTTSTPSSSGAQQTENTKFIKTGIGITVTPQINENNITLKIVPNISEPATKPEEGKAPSINTSDVTTIVSIKNKATLILGGLIKTRQETIINRVPILGYIPLLSYLFSSRSYSTRRYELVIFLTVTIINDGMSIKKDMDKLKKVEKELND